MPTQSTATHDAVQALVDRRGTGAARVIVRRDPKDPSAYWAARDAEGRLGSSDIAALVRGDLWRIWNAKTGHPDAYDNEAMYWGRELEAAVARRTALDHPTWRVQHRYALLGHPRLPFMVCSPDRIIFDAPEGVGLLEAKTARRHWDAIPEPYLAQCQWQMAVTGYRWTMLAVLFTGQDYEEYRIPADPALQHALIQLGLAFHHRVMTDDPPPLDTSDAARRWLLRQYPRAVREEFRPISDPLIDVVRRHKAVTTEMKALKAEEARLGITLREAIGEAKGLAFEGGRVTWVRKTVPRTNLKQMRADHPGFVAEYTQDHREDGGLTVTVTTSKGGSS